MISHPHEGRLFIAVAFYLLLVVLACGSGYWQARFLPVRFSGEKLLISFLVGSFVALATYCLERLTQSRVQLFQIILSLGWFLLQGVAGEITVHAAAWRKKNCEGVQTQNTTAMKNPFQLQVVKTLFVPAWNDMVKAEAITFWQGRGINFDEVTDNYLRGHRGSVWGNLTSFDMSKLITDLTLTISPTEPHEVFCCLEIDTQFQVVTEWNREYWQLELDTFESHLLYGDQKEGEWDQLRKESRASDYLWVLSLGWIRRKMPHKP